MGILALNPNGTIATVAPIKTSVGAADAGKAVALSATNKLDDSLFNVVSSTAEVTFTIEKLPGISIGNEKAVYLAMDGNVVKAGLATNSSTEEKANVAGFCVSSTATHVTVRCDSVNDTLVSAIVVGDKYYLGTGGNTVNTAPTTPGTYLTELGIGLALNYTGSFNPKQPILI